MLCISQPQKSLWQLWMDVGANAALIRKGPVETRCSFKSNIFFCAPKKSPLLWIIIDGAFIREYVVQYAILFISVAT